MAAIPNANLIVNSTTGANALTPLSPYCTVAITATGASLMTLAAPDRDGIEITLVDETGHAHTLVCTPSSPTGSAGLNGGTTSNKLSWNGTAGSAAIIYSRNGFWWTQSLNGVTVS